MTTPSWLAGRKGQRARIGMLALALVAMSAAHLALGVATHREHIAHVFLELGFLLPIVAAAVWFGVRGGVVAGTAAAVFLGAHAISSWRGQPMENANQLSMMLVYVVVGALSGALVERGNPGATPPRRSGADRDARKGPGVARCAPKRARVPPRGHSRPRGTRRRARRPDRARARARFRKSRTAPAGSTRPRSRKDRRAGRRAAEAGGAERSRAAARRAAPVIAANILRHLHGAEAIADIVLAHHERLDGSGYPLGRSEDAIPLEARVLRGRSTPAPAMHYETSSANG